MGERGRLIKFLLVSRCLGSDGNIRLRSRGARLIRGGRTRRRAEEEGLLVGGEEGG